jgi:hypothetical protein
VYAVLALFLVLTSVTTYVLYTNTQSQFRWSLDERLSAIAAVAATRFDQLVLDQIRGPASIPTEPYQTTVLELRRIRAHARNL